MFKGFKEFLLRGNVVDLAVAVVIGTAFNAVVERVVEALFNPLISMFFQADSLDNALILGLPGDAEIKFGAIIGSLINFVIVAAVVYFVFVLPMNKLRERGNKEDDPAAPTEQELLTEIRDLLQSTTAGASAPATGTAPEAGAGDAGDQPHRH